LNVHQPLAMAVLSDLPPELILHIVSFMTRETMLDRHGNLPGYKSREPELVPDLPSINALTRTNTVFHSTLNQCLYDLCASVEPLGKLALFFAVQNQLESTVDRLVAVGISLDIDVRFNNRPCRLLQVAAGMGHRDMVVKLLTMSGAEMRTRVHTRRGWHRETSKNATALDYAANFGHMDIVRLLAPIPTPSPAISRRLYLSVALVEAITVEYSEISEYLISEGADVNFLEEPFISSPLYHAAGTGNLGLVQLLLASGADPNLQIGNIPLFTAVSGQNMDIVQALVEAGADIHVRDDSLQNVLPRCSPSVELLRFFLERGVDPNNEDSRGDIPLHHICRRGPAEFAKASVELLLQFGAATVEKADWRGRTPVDIAMRMGYSEIVQILEPLVQNHDLQSRIAAWREAQEGV